MRPMIVLSIFLTACQGAPEASAVQTPPPPPVAVAPQQIDASRRTAITEATGRVAPAVVTVQTETVQRVPADIFSMFFGGAGATQQR